MGQPDLRTGDLESEVPSPSLRSWSEAGFSPREQQSAGSPDSETTEDDSVQSTSDSKERSIVDVRREVSGAEPKVLHFLNQKSLVIHCVRTEGILKCGRRVSPHFVELYELNGIRCSR